MTSTFQFYNYDQTFNKYEYNKGKVNRKSPFHQIMKSF